VARSRPRGWQGPGALHPVLRARGERPLRRTLTPRCPGRTAAGIPVCLLALRTGKQRDQEGNGRRG